MKLYELSQLPIKERYKLVNYIKENSTELPSDTKLVCDVMEDTINWFPSEERLSLIKKLNENQCELPSNFELIYEIHEKSKIKELSSNERLRIFSESKEGWKELYPDFRRMSDIMEKFKTNEMLVEYGKYSPPPFIHDDAIEVYKKCISFKVKLTKKILSHLNQNPNTLLIHYYSKRIYCINDDKVKVFLNEYQVWNLKMANLWYRIYSMKDKFNSCYAYEDWKRYIKDDLLKGKADEIQGTQDEALSLLNLGEELVLKHNGAIALEYETNAFEMSCYEREKEIAQMYDSEDASVEEYCYVYTLECELFVFYVGIAANPKERFEQHFRGAFSDEAHLFKAKFIQKYHKEVKQSLIYEGTRRECKKFERDYIAEHRPL